MAMTIVFFIIGLSVILSWDWTANSGFRADAGMTIFFAVLVAAIIYVAYTYAAKTPPPTSMVGRQCPSCGRSIPADALLCPYCGLRLS